MEKELGPESSALNGLFSVFLHISLTDLVLTIFSVSPVSYSIAVCDHEVTKDGADRAITPSGGWEGLYSSRLTTNLSLRKRLLNL